MLVVQLTSHTPGLTEFPRDLRRACVNGLPRLTATGVQKIDQGIRGLEDAAPESCGSVALLILRDRNDSLRTGVPQNAFQRAEDLGQLHAPDVRKQMLIFVVARGQTVVRNAR